MNTCSNCVHFSAAADNGFPGRCGRSLTGMRRRFWYELCRAFTARPKIPVFIRCDNGRDYAGRSLFGGA